MKKGYLILENGQVFEGVRFGAQGTAQGELVFNTSMVGYEATLTDGCNYGKILMHTFPQVGNYGMIGEDVDGSATPCAFVCREYCLSPSNFRCEGNLDAYLAEQGVVGLQGVDTRELTRILRDNGSMNAMIADEVPADLTALKSYKVTGAVAALTYGDTTYEADSPKGKVALINYGELRALGTEIAARGYTVDVFPADVTADALSDYAGVLLSDGPDGEAAHMDVSLIKDILGRAPIFAVGLGHLLLAKAQGGSLVKLPYGHRGANQPARTADGSRTYISTQNHGYAVDAGSVKGTETYVNANDGTNEGMSYPEIRAFSVQFVPDTYEGPTDNSYLYDEYINMMEG